MLGTWEAKHLVFCLELAAGNVKILVHTLDRGKGWGLTFEPAASPWDLVAVEVALGAG